MGVSLMRKAPSFHLTFLVAALILVVLSSLSWKVSATSKGGTYILPYEEIARRTGSPTILEIARQVNTHGYITVPDDAMLLAVDFIRAGLLLDVERLSHNTTFSLIYPTWIPSGFGLLGGYPEGPSPAGPWTAVGLVYSDGNAEIHISQWKMTDGWLIFPKELMTASVRGIPAKHAIYRTATSGSYWNEIAWISGPMYFGLRGNVPLSVLLAMADGIESNYQNSD